MKKILLALIAIAMIFAITACSQDQYKSLGEAMGKMSGNIYGITANLKDVENATNKVDGAVAVDTSGTGNVEVKLEAKDAESIVKSVVAVKDSKTKKAELKSSLSQPILSDDALDTMKEKLNEELANQASNCQIDVATVADENKEVAKSVNEVLSVVETFFTDYKEDHNPTKAELATVAVLTTLSEAVKTGTEESLKEAGKAAVDALKITTEIGQVDLFANVDLSKLSDLFARGISRDGDTEEIDLFEKLLPVIGDSIPQVLECITENKQFKDLRYAKFIVECKAIRASYEMIAKAYNINTDKVLKGQLVVDSGLTIEDLGHYIISVIFSAMDFYDGDNNDVVPFLRALVTKENYDDIANINREKLEELIDAIPAYEDATDAMAARMVDGFVPGEDFDFAEFVKTSIRDKETAIGGKTDAVLRTIGAILLDSEYEGLLSQIEVTEENAPEKGSLKCFLYAF